MVPKRLFDRKFKWLLCKKIIKSLLLVIKKLILVIYRREKLLNQKMLLPNKT